MHSKKFQFFPLINVFSKNAPHLQAALKKSIKFPHPPPTLTLPSNNKQENFLFRRFLSFAYP